MFFIVISHLTPPLLRQPATPCIVTNEFEIFLWLLSNDKWWNTLILDPGQRTLSKTVWSSSNLHNIEFTMYLRHSKQKTILPLILIFFHAHLHNVNAIWHQIIPPFPQIPSAKIIKANGCCTLVLPFHQALMIHVQPPLTGPSLFPCHWPCSHSPASWFLIYITSWKDSWFPPQR